MESCISGLETEISLASEMGAQSLFLAPLNNTTFNFEMVTL